MYIDSMTPLIIREYQQMLKLEDKVALFSVFSLAFIVLIMLYISSLSTYSSDKYPNTEEVYRIQTWDL